MIDSNKQQMSESFSVGALLSSAGGFLDAYTYIARGRIFANAQTGNIVLLGINLADGNYAKMLYYLVPILAFVFGVLLAEMIRKKFRGKSLLHWRQFIIVGEIAVLIAVAFIPQTDDYNVLANWCVSFVCAMQVEGFRKFNGNAFASTMCTGNLRSATAKFYKFRTTKDRREIRDGLGYVSIILFFIFGAAVGTFLTKHFAEKAVLFTCILFLAAFFIIFINRKTEKFQN